MTATDDLFQAINDHLIDNVLAAIRAGADCNTNHGWQNGNDIWDAKPTVFAATEYFPEALLLMLGYGGAIIDIDSIFDFAIVDRSEENEMDEADYRNSFKLLIIVCEDNALHPIRNFEGFLAELEENGHSLSDEEIEELRSFATYLNNSPEVHLAIIEFMQQGVFGSDVFAVIAAVDCMRHFQNLGVDNDNLLNLVKSFRTFYDLGVDGDTTLEIIQNCGRGVDFSREDLIDISKTLELARNRDFVNYLIANPKANFIGNDGETGKDLWLPVELNNLVASYVVGNGDQQALNLARQAVLSTITGNEVGSGATRTLQKILFLNSPWQEKARRIGIMPENVTVNPITITGGQQEPSQASSSRQTPSISVEDPSAIEAGNKRKAESQDGPEKRGRTH